MNLQHVNVKIFVDGELTVDLERFLEIFHGWVAEQSMEELLIDVADYRHVPHGPGVVLVGHEADYAMDHAGGRYGLLYNRKAPLEGSNAERFLQALRAASKACSLLETAFSELRFDRHRFEIFINDRALAPNTDETRDELRSELAAFLHNVLGETDFQIDDRRDPRSRVGADVHLSNPLELARLSISVAGE